MSVAILACDLYQIQETALREIVTFEGNDTSGRGRLEAALGNVIVQGKHWVHLCCIVLTGAPMPSHPLLAHGGAVSVRMIKL
jgi:hypothetical protein